jgi:hypothetical protein
MTPSPCKGMRANRPVSTRVIEPGKLKSLEEPDLGTNILLKDPSATSVALVISAMNPLPLPYATGDDTRRFGFLMKPQIENLPSAHSLNPATGSGELSRSNLRWESAFVKAASALLSLRLLVIHETSQVLDTGECRMFDS